MVILVFALFIHFFGLVAVLRYEEGASGWFFVCFVIDLVIDPFYVYGFKMFFITVFLCSFILFSSEF